MTASVFYAAIAAFGDVLGGILVVGPLSRAPTNHATRHLLMAALVAFGAGFMLSVAFIDMLPTVLQMANIEHGMLAVLIGYLVVHLTQHTLTPHFHFGEETHSEAMVSRGIGFWALAGLIPHSFFDGVMISSGFLTSPDMGMLLFVAVVLHKVPTGASLASIMLASGNSGRRAMSAVMIIAGATILGAVVTPAISTLATYGLALSAGVTIYVAASNLIPEAQREPGWIISAGVFLGAAAFYAVRLMLPHA